MDTMTAEQKADYWSQMFDCLNTRGWKKGKGIVDGNPIFSATSRKLKRGVRIIQDFGLGGSDPVQEEDILFTYWSDTYGDEYSETGDELVIACYPKPKYEAMAFQMMARWVVHGIAPALQEEEDVERWFGDPGPRQIILQARHALKMRLEAVMTAPSGEEHVQKEIEDLYKIRDGLYDIEHHIRTGHKR